MATFESIITLLDERGHRPRPSGAGKVQALCPGHDDRNASLSIAQGDDGRVLVHCFAGCPIDRILGALGLSMADLFPRGATTLRLADRRRVTPSAVLPDDATVMRWHRKLVDDEVQVRELTTSRAWSRRVLDEHRIGWDGTRVTIPVYDADGALTGLQRYLPWLERRNGAAKMLAIAGTRRDLFPAPERLDSEVLFVVEGEPDALTMMSIGIPTVAIPGAESWRSDAAKRFSGRHVVVCADCDDAGRRLAARAAADLLDFAATTRLLDLDLSRADGYDVGDLVHEAAGYGRDGLRHVRQLLARMAADAEVLAPGSLSAPARNVLADRERERERERTDVADGSAATDCPTVSPVDPRATPSASVPPLAATRGGSGAAGRAGPSEALAASRVDLLRLIREGIPKRDFLPGTGDALVRGKRHHIAGDAKSGKSLTIGVLAAVELVAAGGTVVVLDRENGAEEYALRLQAVLDSRGPCEELREALSDRYRYHAWPPVSLEWGGDPTYPQALADADLVIFDSSRKFLTAVDLDEDSSDDFSLFAERLIDPLMRAGIATVILDNTGHDQKNRARGTSSKRDLCDVMFSLKAVKPFSLQRSGRVEMTCSHSRLGELTGTWALDLGAGAYGRWRHVGGDEARSTFRNACIASLRAESPLGRDALLRAAREHGAKARTITLRDWLAELVGEDYPPIVHTEDGYALAPRSGGGTTPDQGGSRSPWSEPAPLKGTAKRDLRDDAGPRDGGAPECSGANGGEIGNDARCSRSCGSLGEAAT